MTLGKLIGNGIGNLFSSNDDESRMEKKKNTENTNKLFSNPDVMCVFMLYLSNPNGKGQMQYFRWRFVVVFSFGSPFLSGGLLFTLESFCLQSDKKNKSQRFSEICCSLNRSKERIYMRYIAQIT